MRSRCAMRSDGSMHIYAAPMPGLRLAAQSSHLRARSRIEGRILQPGLMPILCG